MPAEALAQHAFLQSLSGGDRLPTDDRGDIRLDLALGSRLCAGGVSGFSSVRCTALRQKIHCGRPAVIQRHCECALSERRVPWAERRRHQDQQLVRKLSSVALVMLVAQRRAVKSLLEN